MISLLIGIILFFAGLFFLVSNLQQFINFLYGFLPISLVVTGLIAIIAGAVSIRDNIKSKKFKKNKINKN